MTRLEIAAVVAVIIVAGVLWFVSYKACVVKFPNAPTWACVVKP